MGLAVNKTSRAAVAESSPHALARVTSVYRLAHVVSRARTLEQVFSASLDALEEALSADRCSILLFDSDDVMRFKAWRRLSDGYRAAVEGHSPWSRDARTAAPICVSDVASDESLAPYRDTIIGEGIRALAFIPLLHRERLLGKFMVYFDTPHVFTENELMLAESIANHVAIAVERTGAERRLELYRQIFKHSSEAIAVVNLEGQYLEQNASHQALIGYRDDELADQTPAIHLGEEVFARIAQRLQSVGVFRDDVTSCTKSSVRREIELSAFTVRDEGGEPACYVGIKRDVTERKRADEALRLIAAASVELDGSLDFTATLHNAARLATPTLAEVCLVELDHSEGSLPRSSLAHRDADLEARLRSSLEVGPPDAAREPEVFEAPRTLLEVRLGEGARHLGELERRTAMVAPLRARGKTLGRMILVSAPERRYDATDVALAQDLANRAALALDNARLYHEAQEADRRKDEFLAMLAHELRNPLAAAVTAQEVLNTGRAGEKRARLEGVITRQLRAVTRLVDDLLEVSRITRGKIELRCEPIELATMLVRAIENVRPLVDERRHDLSVSLRTVTRVRADGLRLEQVFTNLLTNAAKYTEPGGRIELSTRQEGPHAVVEIRDSGIGIDPEMLDHIFEPFMQVGRSIDSARGGLGVGLTLVRALVEMHGGTITAASSGVGQGSVFTVRLPLLTGAAPRDEWGTDGIATAPNARRVLVIDDNEDAATTLSVALESYGHDVEVAYDADSALAILEKTQPEVVLLDIGLPGISGHELAPRLKQALPPTAKIIAVTGYGHQGARAASSAAGFAAHLVKPIDLGRLLALF